MGLNSKLSSAEEIYNSYLLLYKLNEIKDDNGELLKDVISEAINQGKNQAEFKVKGSSYKVNITEEGGNYELKVLGGGDKPEVKDVLKYTDKNIVDLWAQSKVSVEKGENDNLAFAIHLRDQSRLQNLKIGGLGKKVPFALRFANFYKVIEILKDKETSLEEKLRIANNIATGSGKTGDIALLKFLAYLTSVPCITAVPNENLRSQSNNFDREFLPDEVAQEFAAPFSEIDTKYATTTFSEAFNTNWNVLDSTYGKNKDKLALILIDEAPKLKENAVQMARAFEISYSNPTAFFSATPDAFLSKEFKIKTQVLLSPKEREALGIGKLPMVHYHKMEFKTLEEMGSAKAQGKSKYELRLACPKIRYAEKSENTHIKLNQFENAAAEFKQKVRKHNINDLEDLFQPFLDFISQSLDSQAYKEGLIGTEERWAQGIKDYITEGRKDEAKERRKRRIESFIKAIESLNTGLRKDNIRHLVEKNLNVEFGSKLLSSIKLHNILDTLNEYKKSGREINKDEISEFINKKYGIIDSSSLKFNSELTDAIYMLHAHQGDQDYRKSIERNYPGDKRLHEYIFDEFPDIKNFCEQDAVVCYFNGRIKRFRSNGGQIYEYETDSDLKNILSMVKAGFVPNVISKELALGIDAPRLNRAVAIVKDKAEILDPMFLLQLMGRVGRDAQSKGLCYFDVFTSDESYLKIDETTRLSGTNLLIKLEKSYGSYVQDKEGVIQARSKALCHDLRQNYIGFYTLNPQFIVKSIFDMMCTRIKNEFNSINIQYGYDKKMCFNVFTRTLKNASDELKWLINSHDPEFTRKFLILGLTLPSNVAEEFKKLMKVINNVIILLNSKNSSIIEYSNDMSLEDWSRYVVSVKPMNHEDLIKADPTSSVPIFIEQKERLRVQYVSVHDVGESVSIPNVTSKPFQQASTKKKVMYGIMLAFPFLTVGIYALVTGGAIFNPMMATGIFVGAVMTAAILFTVVKIYEKKAENPGMEVGTAIKETFSTLWSSHKVAV